MVRPVVRVYHEKMSKYQLVYIFNYMKVATDVEIQMYVYMKFKTLN